MYSVSVFELCDPAYVDTVVWRLETMEMMAGGTGVGRTGSLRAKKVISYHLLGEPE